MCLQSNSVSPSQADHHVGAELRWCVVSWSRVNALATDLASSERRSHALSPSSRSAVGIFVLYASLDGGPLFAHQHPPLVFLTSVHNFPILNLCRITSKINYCATACGGACILNTHTKCNSNNNNNDEVTSIGEDVGKSHKDNDPSCHWVLQWTLLFEMTWWQAIMSQKLWWPAERFLL